MAPHSCGDGSSFTEYLFTQLRIYTYVLNIYVTIYIYAHMYVLNICVLSYVTYDFQYSSF